jgi:hypothetical protein
MLTHLLYSKDKIDNLPKVTVGTVNVHLPPLGAEKIRYAASHVQVWVSPDSSRGLPAELVIVE